MTHEEQVALIHAELDGELNDEQRAELARVLLADPPVRALRDELRGLCSRLDALAEVEPPPGFKDSILGRLPAAPAVTAYRTASFGRWRLAALVAGLVTAGAIVYETAQVPAPGSRETAGTMATDAGTIVDSAVVAGSGLVTGRATLHRDRSGLAVGLEVSAAQPVDVLIATGGQSLRLSGLTSPSPAGIARRTVALPGVRMQGQEIELSFLIGERVAGRATLHAPPGP